MKKLLNLTAALFLSGSVFAGGIQTNSNQSASWVRLPAQDASTGISAVYFNPAGLMKLSNGFHFSISNQTVFQNREIENFYLGPSGQFGLNESLYKGKVTAPVFPSIYGVYKMDKLAVSLGFNPIGGGGGAEFKKGLPSFEMTPSDLVPALASQGATAYRLDAYFKGTSVFFGYQLGLTYKINDDISVYGGFRYVTAKNTYKGHLQDVELKMGADWARADAVFAGIVDKMDALLAIPGSLQQLIDGGGGGLTLEQAEAATYIDSETRAGIEQGLAFIGVPTANIPFMNILQIQGAFNLATPTLTQTKIKSIASGKLLRDQSADVKQTGSGICPVLGVNLSLYDKLNIGIKYEFITKMDVKNSTSKDFTTGYLANGDSVTMFPDGDKISSDIPAMLSVGVSALATDKLTVNAGMHIYFDKAANYGRKISGRYVSNESLIDNNYLELAAGLEYKITDKILVSAGYLYSKTGVSDKYQRDDSYSLSSSTIGAGGAYNITEKIQVNLGIGYTMYQDGERWFGRYSEAIQQYSIIRETYYKDNIFFAIGVDFSL